MKYTIDDWFNGKSNPADGVAFILAVTTVMLGIFVLKIFKVI